MRGDPSPALLLNGHNYCRRRRSRAKESWNVHAAMQFRSPAYLAHHGTNEGDGLSAARRFPWAQFSGEPKMKRVVLFAATVCLAVTPALAASPKVDAAVKAFKAVSADPAKQKTFCEMSKAMDAAGDKPSPAADAKINGLMKQLGSDFETAWGLAEGLDEKSADGKAYNNALDDLAGKCS
jgi:hypothetical protein